MLIRAYFAHSVSAQKKRNDQKEKQFNGSILGVLKERKPTFQASEHQQPPKAGEALWQIAILLFCDGDVEKVFVLDNGILIKRWCTAGIFVIL